MPAPAAQQGTAVAAAGGDENEAAIREAMLALGPDGDFGSARNLLLETYEGNIPLRRPTFARLYAELFGGAGAGEAAADVTTTAAATTSATSTPDDETRTDDMDPTTLSVSERRERVHCALRRLGPDATFAQVREALTGEGVRLNHGSFTRARRRIFGDAGANTGQAAGQQGAPPAEAPAVPAAVATTAAPAVANGSCTGTDGAPQLLADLASLLRRTGGVAGLKRLLGAIEATAGSRDPRHRRVSLIIPVSCRAAAGNTWGRFPNRATSISPRRPATSSAATPD